MRVVVYSDIHAPFHDGRAIALVNDACRQLKPNKVYIAGDLIDFYAISKFDKSPNRATPNAMSLEVESTRQILQGIRRSNPSAEITLITGNQ